MKKIENPTRKQQLRAARSRRYSQKPEKRLLLNEIQKRYSKQPKTRIKRRRYERNKYKTDSSFRLRQSMSYLVWHCLVNGKEGYSWESTVGYTVNELKQHLEKHFQEGMSWDNYGKWHIDHIIPVSFFQFKSSNDVEFKMCWRLENLQPLWAGDNLSKHDKLLGSLTFRSKLAG